MSFSPTVSWATPFRMLQTSLTLALSVTSVQATLFNVDFNGGAYDVLPNPTYTGPAVTGETGDTWNGFDATSGNGPHFLVDAKAARSTVEMTYSAMDGLYNAGAGDLFKGKPYVDLMSAFSSFKGTAPVILTLTGFVPDTAYSLWIYTGGDTGSSETDNGSTWTVNAGTSQTSKFDYRDAGLAVGTNCLFFTGTTSLSGELKLEGTKTGIEGFMNGIQVEGTPTPYIPLAIASITRAAAGDVQLSLQTKSLEKYRVQTSPNMLASTWKDPSVTLQGTGNLESVTVPLQGTGTKWFYRVGTTPDDIDNLAPTPSSSSTVELAWADVKAETGYEVQWANNAAFTNATTLPPLTANVTSVTVTELNANTLYNFRIRALQTNGLPSLYTTASATTKPASPFIVVSTGGAMDASSQPFGGEEATKANDGLKTTKWLGNMQTTGTWLRYTFATATPPTIKVKGFKITTANDAKERHPKNFKLQGSNDGGTTWADIVGSSFSGQSAGQPGSIQEYDCAGNTVAYASVRLLIESNNGDANVDYGGSGLVQLAEWQLIGNP